MYSPRKKYRHAGVPALSHSSPCAFAGACLQPQGRPPQGQGANRGRSSGPSLNTALRGSVAMGEVADINPGDLLARHAHLGAKELSFTSFAGEPLYVLGLGDGTSRYFAFDGRAIAEFDREKIVEIVTRAVPNPESLELRTVDQYDYYYFDRTRQRPLPVFLALTHDDDGTRYYIDPRTASIVGTYSDRNWAQEAPGDHTLTSHPHHHDQDHHAG
jgi:hypothetical protein